MGNIIENDQFKTKLQELIQSKKFKRTLKTIYKENNNHVLSIQSCEIIDYPLTIKQYLEERDRKSCIFQHKCKIFLDIKEVQRYYDSCNICKKKIKFDRSVNHCSNCNQETSFKCAFCLKVKIIDMISEDNSEAYQATMFEEATKYLGIQAKDFANMDNESQNNYFKKINEQKSQIVYLLKLEYKQEIPDFIIKEILPQITQ